MRQEFAHSVIKHGTHPIFLLKVFWTRDTVGYYSDAKNYEYFEPKLLSIGSIGFSVSVTKSSESSSVSVTLDDTDGTIKAILDTYDVHKASALVYQGFQDLEFTSLEASAFLLVSGEISTPIVWKESDRTISFDIVSQVENRQIGFSPNQGFFEGLSDDQAEKTWPLGFGEVIYQECPSVTTRRTGKIATEYESLTLDKLENIDTAYDEFYNSKVALDAVKAEPDIKKKPSLINYAELIEKFNYSQHYLWELVRWTEHVCNLRESQSWSDYLNLNFNIYELKFEANTKNGRLYNINYRLLEISKILAGGGIDNLTRARLIAEQTLLNTEKETLEERVAAIDILLSSKLTERKDKLILILTFGLTSFELDNTHTFPTDGTIIFIVVNGAKFEGRIYSGTPTTFNIENIVPTNLDVEIEDLENTEQPHKYIATFKVAAGQANLTNQYCLFEKSNQKFIVFVSQQTGTICYYRPQIFKRDTVLNYDFEPIIIDSSYNLLQTSSIFLKEWLDLFEITPSTIVKLESFITGVSRLEPNSFSLKVGDTAYLYSDTYSEIHIVNCVPRYYAYSNIVSTGDEATEYVEGVYAYRTINERKLLQRVDPALYTLVENYEQGDVVLTYLKIAAPLSELDNTYEDTIYVSYKSGAANGSQNTADIIKYLILCFTYDPTGYNVNALSFLAAASKLLKYPMNFSILNRENTLDFVNQLAYQNRCAIYWYNKVAYITYLPYFENLLTIDKDYILNNSLELSYESTDNVVTENIATWRLHPLQEKEHKLTVRFNVNKFGKITEETDYFALKHRATIEKSLTYWGIQKAFSYKILTFQGPLSLLRLMPFDQITIELEAGIVSNLTEVKCEVISLSYDPNQLLCTVQVKTNIRAGEMTEYWFRWPYDVVFSWPYQYDIDYVGGNKAGLEGPTDLEELTFDLTRSKDYGKEILSDAADSESAPTLLETTPYRPSEPPKVSKNTNLVLNSEKTFITDSTGKVARLDTLIGLARTYPNRDAGNYPTRAPADFVALQKDFLIVGKDLFGNETRGSTINLKLNHDNSWIDERLPFIAVITGNDGLIENYSGAYKYSWEEVYVGHHPDSYIANLPIRSGGAGTGNYAYNLCEAANLAPGSRYGNGIIYDQANKIPGTNLSFQPVPPQTQVIMIPVIYFGIDGKRVIRYVFNLTNGTDGDCV